MVIPAGDSRAPGAFSEKSGKESMAIRDRALNEELQKPAK
jgi:hypothetical protein